MISAQVEILLVLAYSVIIVIAAWRFRRLSLLGLLGLSLSSIAVLQLTGHLH